MILGDIIDWNPKCEVIVDRLWGRDICQIRDLNAKANDPSALAELKDCHALVASPSCQAVSVMGEMRGEYDPRCEVPAGPKGGARTTSNKGGVRMTSWPPFPSVSHQYPTATTIPFQSHYHH